MQPAALLSRILAVQPVLDAIERDQATPRTPFDTLAIGQIVSGRVVSQGRGVAQVEIAGQSVDVELPQAAAVGDSIALKFAGRNPLPQFVAVLPDAMPSAAPQLSPTARLLSDAVQNLAQRGLPTLTPTAPLLTAPGIDPAQLAAALRNALGRSGLFYESHLADWIVGRDSLDGLMQEPQNRSVRNDAAAQTGQPRVPGNATQAPSTATRALALALAADPAQPPPGQTGNPLHGLLLQQLQVLETPVFAWRGELWPGQALDWQVQRDQDQEPATPNPAESPSTAWQSQLKLSLPQLGAVTIQLRLDAHNTLSMEMNADKPTTAPLLQTHQPQLAARLAAAGCTLASVKLQVRAETHDGDA